MPGLSGLAARSTEWWRRVPHHGLLVWSSEDGRSWRRRSNHAFRGRGGYASIDLLVKTPIGLLATSGGPTKVLASADGIEWREVADVPPYSEWGGSEGLAWAGDTVVFASDDDSPGGRSMGNRLGVWRLEADGTWSKVMDMQAAFTRRLVVAGSTLLVVGDSWDAQGDGWPWLAVSHDGTRTWDADLSWVGSRSSCLGDTAGRGQRVVARGCRGESGALTLWVTDVPTPEDATPDPSDVPAD